MEIIERIRNRTENKNYDVVFLLIEEKHLILSTMTFLFRNWNMDCMISA